MLQFTIITNLNRLRIGLIFLSFNSLTLHIKHNKLSLKITKNDVFLQKKCVFLRHSLHFSHISSFHDFFPIVEYFFLQFSNPVREVVFHFCAIIAVKRILKPKVASVIPVADQNISYEIFFHIVVTNFKIAVQENTILHFNQFVQIFDN